MRYCLYCKRINAGQPLYCQFCAHSFDVRICRSCRHINDPEVLACGNCGGRDFSEPAGSSPPWLVFLKIFFWFFIIFLLLGLIRVLLLNFIALSGFIIILVFLYLGYLSLPELLQGLIRRTLKAIKDCICNKQRRE